MSNVQTLAFHQDMAWIDKVSRKLLFSVFARLPAGSLTLKEQGVLVQQFGQRNSDLQAQVDIRDSRAYRHLMFGGSIASGETYTDSLWDSPDVTKVIQIFARNLPMLDAWEDRMRWLVDPMRNLANLAKRNSIRQAKANISAHYDLGNRLYSRFLDSSMLYSAAIYPEPHASLSDAQQHKLKTICDKLQLKAGDHLLEIGTGWGALAVYAAEQYGCKVTTTTISEEQHAYAKQWIAKAGLQQQITLLKKDYRLLEGQYDKLVSIEMIEAVGKKYLPTFVKQCQSLLRADGLMLLQSIVISDQRYHNYSQSVDFIQKHIFPGGFLPSQCVLSQAFNAHSDFAIRDLQDIGLDYARTLADWRDNFNQAEAALAQDGYDQRFMRLWRYYLSYCEGGFLERTISTVQLLLARPEQRQALFR